jgi:hypothetical protein
MQQLEGKQPKARASEKVERVVSPAKPRPTKGKAKKDDFSDDEGDPDLFFPAFVKVRKLFSKTFTLEQVHQELSALEDDDNLPSISSMTLWVRSQDGPKVCHFTPFLCSERLHLTSDEPNRFKNMQDSPRLSGEQSSSQTNP